MSIDVRDVHIAVGKILQFIEMEKIPRDVAIAALRSAAQTTEETATRNNSLLMLAQFFKPYA